MSRFEAPPGIITNGLVLNLDAGDPDSYTRSQPPYVEVLVVAGGGAGGGYHAGGGGAGGVIYNSAYQLTNASAITVTIGAGGGAATNSSNTGDPGSNSVFGSLTAIGGGAGISQGNSPIARNNGGSGGGAADGSGGVNHPGGSGTPGQGFDGGNIFGDGPNQYYLYGTAGGGGAGGNGIGNIITGGGAGGPGSAFSISGTTTYYGGGGGGTYLGPGTLGVLTADYGIGGVGGGGRGGYTSTAGGTVVVYSTSGTNNTGGGGGGFLYFNNGGGAGGSGIVIVRYPGLQAATGGTITYLNGYTIHTFTSSGTFTPYLWNDVSGNGKNATFTNGVPSDSYVNYIKGGYMSGFSTDDYWNVGNTPYGVIPTGTSTRTIFTAFRTPTTLNSGIYYHIFHYGTANTDNAFGLAIYGNLLNNHTWAGNSNFSNFTLSADTDYIVAVRFNNSNSPRNNFFINGTFGTTGFGQGKTADYAINTGTSNEPRVGMRIDSPTEGLNNGRVYALYIYNSYLSDAEITQNYNALRPRIGI
jgi:hypothetical protein